MSSVLNEVKSTINYGIDTTFQKANKIVSNPSTVKKVLEVAEKIIAGCDYYSGISHYPELIKSMKGTTDLINGFNTVKNIIFWINPFTKDKIDQNHLQLSLARSLQQQALTAEQSKTLSHALVDHLLADPQSYYSSADVLDALKQSLIQHNYTEKDADKIIAQVEVQQKSRPVLQLLSTACFTFTGVVGNIKVLQKWDVLNPAAMLEIGSRAASIGSQSKIFTVILEFGIDRAVNAIAVVGLTINVIDAISKLSKARKGSTGVEDMAQTAKTQAAVERAFWDLGTAGLDLVAMTVPLLVAVSPPVVIALALVSKGTGLIKVIYWE